MCGPTDSNVICVGQQIAMLYVWADRYKRWSHKVTAFYKIREWSCTDMVRPWHTRTGCATVGPLVRLAVSELDWVMNLRFSIFRWITTKIPVLWDVITLSVDKSTTFQRNRLFLILCWTKQWVDGSGLLNPNLCKFLLDYLTSSNWQKLTNSMEQSPRFLLFIALYLSLPFAISCAAKSTYLHLVPKLRIRTALSPVSHML